MSSRRFASIASLLGVAIGCALPQPAVLGQESPVAEQEIVLRDALVIERVGSSGRSAVHADAIEALIVTGRWTPPQAGDTVKLPDGSEKTWEAATADKDGNLKHRGLRGGYAYWPVTVDQPAVMLLTAVGHSRAYVNGVLRTGDPYRTGNVRLPIELNAGHNWLMFHCGRGQVTAKLVTPEAPVTLDTRDATLPDLIVDERTDTWGAVVVINATNELLSGLTIEATHGDAKPTRADVPPIPPASIRKVGFRLKGRAPDEAGEREYDVRLVRGDGDAAEVLAAAQVTLRIRRPEDRHKRTFISEIDGSVQYYAVTPAHPAEDNSDPPAMFLTVHGAGVEAMGQAGAYAHKTWGHVVAATNRRPFGFDWEDWGRLDAMEVLSIAEKRFGTDPLRTYLLGHSMGGHGVWHMGVVFPDRFAAIAPSAGWVSFWSYSGAQRFEDATPIEEMLIRATATSDTLSLSRNYLHHGVYVLHGEKDNNVPVGEARTMREHLAKFHADFAYYERPGAGHWWGNACVDWPPLFDFLESHTRPKTSEVRHIEFVTANPGVSASSHWVTIEAQTHALQPSKVDINFDPEKRRFVGTTENVARLALSFECVEPGEPISVELDGLTISDISSPAGTHRVWFAHDGETWSSVGVPPRELKGPHRYGPFKQAFRNRMIFVYGTQGSDEENAWAFAKARYDAETFWYRGNGSIDVVPDTAFDPAAEPDRNVILFGNADTNGTWKSLLADSPVQVRRGSVSIGQRDFAGDDLACLFVRPRPGSDTAAIAVVSGSGASGMRLTDRLPYFVSGVGYPDCTVLGPEVLTDGTDGIRAAGFFGIDWGVDTGDFAWQPRDEDTRQ